MTQYTQAALAKTCWQRWVRAGKPEIPPPPPPGCPRNDRRRPERIEDYADLLAWGETREAAAARLGVCMRTLERYDAALRAAGDRDWPGEEDGYLAAASPAEMHATFARLRSRDVAVQEIAGEIRAGEREYQRLAKAARRARQPPARPWATRTANVQAQAARQDHREEAAA